MVIHPLPAIETSGAGGLNDSPEIPVVGVAQHPRKITAGPEFISCRIGAADVLMRSMDWVKESFQTKLLLQQLGPWPAHPKK